MGLKQENGLLMAVKEIPFDAGGQNDIAAMHREIFLFRSLQHPNLVQYFGSKLAPPNNDDDDAGSTEDVGGGERGGDGGGIFQIFTEWVPGGSLWDLVKEFGKLHTSVVQSYTRQILEAVSYLHRHEVVHRDVRSFT